MKPTAVTTTIAAANETIRTGVNFFITIDTNYSKLLSQIGKQKMPIVTANNIFYYSNMYDQVFELQAQLLKALAHPRRLEIVQLLRDQELCVSDMYEMLDLPQANISQHLMILREANVVETQRSGKQIVYRLTSDNIIEASDLLRDVLIRRYQGSQIADQLAVNMLDLVPIVHDPVCQMRVSPKTAGFSSTHQGHQYFFCASGCQKKFRAKPEAYVT